jgi:predicted PurR-regulated permease PerM
MNAKTKLPFYIGATIFLVGLFAFISILYLTQSILLPLIYSAIFAVLISPAVNFLVRKKVNRTLAISIVLLVALMLATGLIVLISSQATHFRDAWPQLARKFDELINQGVVWASGCFHIDTPTIDAWIDKSKGELMSKGGSMIGVTLSTMSGVFAAVVLVPVYIFMILYYQPHLIEFVHRVFGAGNDNKVSEILSETKGIIKGYLVGLFLEFIIVAILNSAGLLILGIQYAVLLGVVAAILNAIPFIGGIIGIFLFVVIALVSKSPIYVVYVVALYSLIQFIDNHYIIPKIIGSKVKLNALVCLIAVVMGGVLWGVPGMFLSIPLTAIIKVIFDRIDSLKSWGFLLGDTGPDHPGLQLGAYIKGLIQKIIYPKPTTNHDKKSQV